MIIKVLHIVTYMGRGGLESMIMNYYRNIDRNKIQFDFLVHRDFEADYDREIENMGGRIYRMPRLNPFSKKYMSELSKFFDSHKEYNIVHCHLDCMAGIPLKVAKAKGIPVRIAHAHSSNQTKDYKYLIKLYFKRNISHYANMLFACGQEAGNWMFNGNEFYILNNAIEAKNYIYSKNKKLEMRSSLGIPNDAMVIGHVGRFATPKNHNFIIDIFSEIIKYEQQSYLLLVGDGELRKSIENKAKELGIYNRVIFTGLRADVPNLLQAMDIFLFPSLYEGLPVSVVEAQASGLPCLISNMVPLECKKTDLVYQVHLEESTRYWADMAINLLKKHKRINTFLQIKDNNFDIGENAKWLESFYEKCLIKQLEEVK